MASEKVKSFLDKHEINYELMEHDVAYTAQEIAAVTHVKGKELAKAVIVRAGTQIYMAVLPATRVVDFDKMKGLLDVNRVDLAREEEFSKVFHDCETGAMPPFGSLYDVPTIMDESLAEDEEIVFNAGTHHDVMKVSFQDYVSLENPKVGAFTKHI